MDIFHDIHSKRDTDRENRFASTPFDEYSTDDKLDRSDRFVDTSYQVSIQDKRSLKVDRVDRYRLTPRVR